MSNRGLGSFAQSFIGYDVEGRPAWNDLIHISTIRHREIDTWQVAELDLAQVVTLRGVRLLTSITRCIQKSRICSCTLIRHHSSLLERPRPAPRRMTLSKRVIAATSIISCS